ncbi:MAG TPA: hypothetical protein VKS60_09385 [Stellaceae bacterium]|nr:hypothetical protein [Stellaceae bacterium]
MPIFLAFILGGVAEALYTIFQGGWGPGFALMAVSLITPLAAGSVRTALTTKHGLHRVASVVLGVALVILAFFLAKECAVWLFMVSVDGRIWAAFGVALGLIIGTPKSATA